MSRWRTYSLYDRGIRTIPSTLPAIPGVYAVYFDDDLVYVGSSVDIRNRFSEHRIRHSYGKSLITPWQEVPADTKVEVKIKPSRRRGDWATWEIRLIYRLKPLFNRQLVGRKVKAL